MRMHAPRRAASRALHACIRHQLTPLAMHGVIATRALRPTHAVARYCGCDRVELMTTVMQSLQKCGISLPKPPVRERMSIAEAEKIARAKRDAAREQGVRPQGW